MPAYFCEQTGKRIAAPGVCKDVDPVKGQDEFSEQPIELPIAAATADKSEKHEKLEHIKPSAPHKGK